MGKPLVVIGSRLGKGQNIKIGVEKAGGEAIVIPGIGADMKLADKMKEVNADLGLSFCGSGGAGALNAQNLYGYKCKYDMHSVEQAEAAISEGVQALGLAFMDTEELGMSVVKAWKKKYGEWNAKQR